MLDLVQDAISQETSGEENRTEVSGSTKRKNDEIGQDSDSNLVATRRKKGMELVREKGNEDLFLYLLENCYGVTLQRHIWLRGLRNNDLHDVITSYDEALVLLLLENNLLMWQDMSAKKTLKPKECTVKPVYTTSRGKGVGWSWKGIARFNALLKTVEKQRKLKQMEVQESEFLARYRTKKIVNKGREIEIGARNEKMLLEEEEPMFAVPTGNKNRDA